MDSQCRAVGCDEPSQRLPEEMQFLRIALCSGHIQKLQAVQEEAQPRLQDYAVLVEARRLISPPDGPMLTALEGGRAD